MRRRQLLAGVAGALGTVAGCPATQRERPTRTPAPVPTADRPSTTATADPTAARFDGEPCPTFDDRTDRSVCGHVESAASALRLRPSRPVVTLTDGAPNSPLRFTLRWRGPEDLSVFARSWYLMRAAREGGWVQTATASADSRLVRLSPGERFDWVLDDVTADERLEPVGARVTPGRYAFAVQTVETSSGLHSECIGLFDVVAAERASTADRSSGTA